MVDRSISRQHRWKVKGRLAVLEYAAQHGVRPAAARFDLDRKTFGPGDSAPARPARPGSSRAIPRDADAASPIGS